MNIILNSIFWILVSVHNAGYSMDNTLCSLVTQGDLVGVSRCLQCKRVNVNAEDRAHNTPLLIAAKKGNLPIVSVLLREGANANAITSADEAPFLSAAQSGNSVIVNFLLEHGANVNLKVKSGLTPLMVAARFGHGHLVRQFLSKNADYNDTDQGGKTPLIWATVTPGTSIGRRQIIQSLIQKGAQVNSQDKEGNTALMYCVQNGFKDETQILLENGADALLKNMQGLSAVDLAVAKPDILALLKGASGESTSKSPAVSGYTATARRGAAASSGFGYKQLPPLLAAIDKGDIEEIMRLMEDSATYNKRNAIFNNIDTPLVYAVSKNKEEVVKVLLWFGVDINAPSRYGHTPLTAAVEAGNKNLVELLLAEGAHVNIVGKNRMTPLMIGATRGNKEIVKLLLSYNADVTIESPLQTTVIEMIEQKSFIEASEQKKFKEIAELLKKSLIFVPDDIAVPSCWLEQDADVQLKTQDVNFNKKCHFRKKSHYEPKTTEGRRLIIWILVHGTWGTETPSFFDDNNPYNQNYRHIKRTATWYATKKKMPLDFYSFKWSGDCNDQARKEAAEVLALFLKEKETLDPLVVVLAHSHGCNVANILSQIVDETHPLHWLIYFACPIREEKWYAPTNYRQLLYFYSLSDRVAPLARMMGAEIKSGRIVSQIAKFLYGDNEFAAPEGKISVGIHTKLNGNNAGHGNIVNIVALLKKIMKKLHNKFFFHYSYSGNFFLNGDFDGCEKPVYLVVMPLAEHDIALSDYLGKSNTPTLDLKTELAEADRQRKRFRKKYRGEIYQ